MNGCYYPPHKTSKSMCAYRNRRYVCAIIRNSVFYVQRTIENNNEKTQQKISKNKMVVQENLFFTLSQIITTPFTHSKAASSKKNWKCCC